MNRYFRLRPADKPEVNGKILRITQGKLELFVGIGNISELGVSVKDGEIIYSEKYSLEEINEQTANQLKEDADNWHLLQGYTASLINKNVLLPGDHRSKTIM